jgi:protein SCO1/2
VKRPAIAAVLAAMVFSATLSVLAARAHDEHRHTPSAGKTPAARSPKRLDEAEQRNYFTDTRLLTQDGREVRFYTDVLQGKVVLISFFYTNCTDICPVLMHNLQDVQDLLGDRFGRDVFFVSISVDPEDDTPEEIEKYSRRYSAKAGWTFLTGKKEDVDRVVQKLGQYSPDFEDHSMLFLLGDVKNARWRKIKGDLPPEAVAPLVFDLLERR